MVWVMYITVIAVESYGKSHGRPTAQRSHGLSYRIPWDNPWDTSVSYDVTILLWDVPWGCGCPMGFDVPWDFPYTIIIVYYALLDRTSRGMSHQNYDISWVIF